MNEQAFALAVPTAVRAALDAQRAVVALESTVIAHGLPYPRNLEVARAMESIIRAGGAQPATIGVIAGQPTIGMDDATIERFATATGVLKLSRRDLGVAIATGRDGATTVAGTMALAHAAGIEIFATGGVGGVHRGARNSWDISGDLTELSRTPVLVVCAGVKSILDLPATLEMLETLGVPVVGYRTDEFPAFYSVSSGLQVTARADSPEEAAAIWRAHRHFGGSGMLLVVPPPAESALSPAEIDTALTHALTEVDRRKIHGAEVTPFLLDVMKDQTGGRSLEANVALLLNNAGVAAEVAAAISSQQ